MVTAILQAIASVLGIFLVYYTSKKLHDLLQWYRDSKQKEELEETTKKSQDQNQQANKDAEDLRKIDGR